MAMRKKQIKIAVLSGKGGTGKTFISVNLAACATSAIYLDCDVEEPHGHLFLKPENVSQKPVCTLLPVFDELKCIGCRKCIDFCRFNALAFIGKTPQVFSDVCHSCGGCALICPCGAVTEKPREIGYLECGIHKNVSVISGVLNVGEASGVSVIQAVLQEGSAQTKDFMVIDCPPGSACTVMESIEHADYCILVAEPTVFGVHNFEMVYELVQLLKKPCGVVINKAAVEHTVLDELCKKQNIPVLCKVPYSEKTALAGAMGQLVSESDNEMHHILTKLLNRIQEEVTQ